MRIAVVGGGVSGLGAALPLARVHDVVLYEADDRLGGHAHTHEVSHGGRSWRLDTGFLVFNTTTYPAFCGLLDDLGVASIESDMALSVRCRACRLEYALRGPRSLFAQPRNLVRTAFYGMFRDIGRFFRDARTFLEAPDPGSAAGRGKAPSPAPDLTVAEFLERGGYGAWFSRHWLLPTSSALWSAPTGDILTYSARMLLTFFRNHGFLQRRQLRWRTVAGGSRSYVDALAARLGDRVRLSSAVERVERVPGGVLVTVRGRPPERFDAVVLACHADQASQAWTDADADERALLGRFRYARHRVTLHTDRSFLPRSRHAWSAWNCDLADCRDASAPASLTYYLNRLQGLKTETPFCVTLNPDRPPEGAIAELSYAHPTLTADAVAAQAELSARNGTGGLWFAGAHLRNGFHEDGLTSGLRVAARLGAQAGFEPSAGHGGVGGRT